MTNRIVHGDNLPVLRGMRAGSVELIYVDPPFNTGRRQARPQMKTVRDEAGDRVGFGGRRYRTELVIPEGATGPSGYEDRFDDFLGFLRPRMVEARRLLTETGSLFFHIDPREVHYCKVMLDEVFGRECFQNEIIWAYDYGARAKKRWANASIRDATTATSPSARKSGASPRSSTARYPSSRDTMGLRR